jgi:hypothetical protein
MTLAGLRDGSHLFSVSAINGLGVLGEPAQYSWVVDTLNPEVVITQLSPATSPTNIGSFSVWFSANESSSFTCSFDGGSAIPCQSPYSLSALGDGEHLFQVWAEDLAGNKTFAATEYAWVVDTTAPVISIGSVEPSGSLINSNFLSLFMDSNEQVNFECQIDGAGFSACNSPWNLSALSDGDHNLLIRASDLAQNMSETLSYSFKIDTIAPQILITSVSPSEALSSSTEKSFSFSGNEAIAHYECQLNGQGFQDCSSPIAYAGLVDGSYLFEVRGTDLAGNISSSIVSYSWKVDTLAPQTTLTSVSPSESPTSSTSIAFYFASNEANSTYECSMDGLGFGACSSPYTSSGLGDGNHSFQVRAKDQVGNIDSTPAAYSWSVQTIPLQLSNLGVSGISRYEATLSWISNVPATSKAEVKNLVTGATWETSTNSTLKTSHSLTLTGLARYTMYEVRAISVSATGEEVKSSWVRFRTYR